MDSGVMICSATYGGCGYVGPANKFRSIGGDTVLCPNCNEDHTFQLTEENIDRLTNENNGVDAHILLENAKGVTA